MEETTPTTGTDMPLTLDTLTDDERRWLAEVEAGTHPDCADPRIALLRRAAQRSRCIDCQRSMLACRCDEDGRGYTAPVLVADEL